MMVVIVIVLLGMVRVSEEVQSQNYTKYLGSKQSIVGHVTTLPEEKTNSYRVVLRISAIQSENQWYQTNGKLLVYMEKGDRSAQLSIGDQIVCYGSIEEICNAGNPNEFDYRSYMQRRHIYAQCYVPSDQWKETGQIKGHWLARSSGQLRRKIMALFDSYGMDQEEYGVMSALSVGYKNAIPDPLKNDYASAGAIHVLAISGLHVGIIYLMLQWGLLFLVRIKYGSILRMVIILAVLFFYAVLTGLSPSVMRASTMFAFVLVGQSFRRPTNVYNSIAVSAFVLLMINPHLIYEVGFQLSYAAVVSIVYFFPKIDGWVQISNPLLKKIWSLVAVSLAAQIGVFPLVLYYFHQFPVYFFITSVFAIPLVTMAIYITMGVFVLMFTDQLLSYLIQALEWIIQGLNTMVHFISDLPFATIDHVFITTVQLVLLYVGLFAITGFFIQKKSRYLIMFLIGIICYIGYDCKEQLNIQDRRDLYVYNLRGQSVYDVVTGKRNKVFFESSDSAAQDIIHNRLNEHWIKSRLHQTTMFPISECIKADTLPKGSYPVMKEYVFLPGYDNSVLLVRGRRHCLYDTEKMFETDYLVINDDVPVNIPKLKEAFRFTGLVLDASISSRKLQKWISACKQHHVAYYSVAKEGAFHVSL